MKNLPHRTRKETAQRLFHVPGHEEDVVLTPTWLFDALDIDFDLDPCGAVGGDHVPAAYRYTIEDDGLAHDWFGRVWLNPPFSYPEPWTDRFIEHGHGIALTPASRSHWHRRLWRTATVAVFTDKLMTFDGRGFPLACMLWAFGADCAAAVGRVGQARWIGERSDA